MTNREIDAFYRKLGDNIKAARQSNNWNQSGLAQALDISRASVVNLEKGRQRPPLHTLFLICVKLNCNYQDIIPSDFNESNNPNSVENNSELKELEKYPEEDQEKIKSFLKNIHK